MAYLIEAELAKFAGGYQQLTGRGYECQQLADFAYTVRPANYEPQGLKAIGLTILGLVHGNEWVGAAVLNEVIGLLARGHFKLQIPVAFVLGNPWAAKENRRFLESDLNRSFAATQRQTKEQRRAADLEAILGNTAFLLDFHQTSERSEQPFFIFPFTPLGFRFASAVAMETPIVTHWGRPFSKEGRCSDEFVNVKGGAGITLELGKNGFDPYQIGAGFAASVRALELATDYLVHGAKFDGDSKADIYTWAEVIDYPEGEVVLESGFVNFAAIAAGQKLATVNGKPLFSKYDGRILFPAYPKPGLAKKPAELCRIMRRVGVEELPFSS